jgi:hypothetical protein
MARERRDVSERSPGAALGRAARKVALRAADAAVTAATGGTGRAARLLLPLAVGFLAMILLMVALSILGAVVGGEESNASTCGPVSVSGSNAPPANLLPIYQGAAARYGLGPQGWAYLAAINRVETDFGQNLAVSSAGAIGWMQFEPSTWAKYGVNATGTGVPDPYNPNDAIYAAANMLHANGAPADWSQAIYAYNHAGWYVQEVDSYAYQYLREATGGSSSVTNADGCAPGTVSGSGLDPIPGFTPGRDDMGVDACAKPGQPIIAPAASTLVEVVPDWYAGQPLLLFRFNQPLAGTLDNDQYWYVAEQITPVTIHTETVFQARQVVARFASSGSCIEIGWGSPTSRSRTLASISDPGSAHPASGALTNWGETFKRYFQIPWVGVSPR